MLRKKEKTVKETNYIIKLDKIIIKLNKIIVIFNFSPFYGLSIFFSYLRINAAISLQNIEEKTSQLKKVRKIFYFFLTISSFCVIIIMKK